MLRQTPAFTLIAVSSLGLGTAATVAVFTVVDALMWRKLPVENPSRLVTLEQLTSDGHREYNFSYQDYERFTTGLSSIFSGMYATTWADAYNVQSAGQVDEGLARVSVVTGNFFNVLGARIEQGRALTAAMIVRLARIPLRSSAMRIGRDDLAEPHRRRDAHSERRHIRDRWRGRSRLLRRLGGLAHRYLDSGSHGLCGVSRIRHRSSSRTPPPAQADCAARTWRHAASSADPGLALLPSAPDRPAPSLGHQQGRQARVASAATGYSRQRETIAQPLTLLMFAASIVLVIACVNTANLLLARAAARGARWPCAWHSVRLEFECSGNCWLKVWCSSVSPVPSASSLPPG